MIIHRIDIGMSITQEAAKTLAQILISAQGIKTPTKVKVVHHSEEHMVLIE